MTGGAKLILVNVMVVCLLIPVAEYYGGRSLPPGVEWAFFGVGATGLAALGVLWLLRGWRRLRRSWWRVP